MSRIPVASTTITPGLPSANRRYQSTTSRVTRPSSVARHGTIAGTQVRDRAVRLPMATGENSRDAVATSAVGQLAIGSANFLRSAGCHMALAYHVAPLRRAHPGRAPERSREVRSVAVAQGLPDRLDAGVGLG